MGPFFRTKRARHRFVLVVSLFLVAAFYLFPQMREQLRQRRFGPELPEGLASQVLAELRAEAAAAPSPEGPVEAQLRQAVAQRTRLELAVLQEQQGAVQAMVGASTRAQQLMGDYLAAQGAERYRAFAARMSLETVKALRTALQAAEDAGEDLATYVQGLKEGGAEHRAATDRYGSFLLGVALPSGLVSDRGEPVDGLDAYAAVILDYRWLKEAQRLRGAPLELSPAARRLFLRWRVERAVVSPTRTRLRSLEELARLEPDYPADRARDLILLQAQSEPEQKKREAGPSSSSPGAGAGGAPQEPPPAGSAP